MAQDIEELIWPKQIQTSEYLITLYQPQLEKLEGDDLSGRFALSVRKNQEDLIFGAAWFKVRLETDRANRTAALENIDIETIKFPDLDTSDENIRKLAEVIENDIEASELVISMEQIIASLKDSELDNLIDDQLDNEAPKIYFRQEPTVLVFIDGEPRLKTTEESGIEFVQNTPFFIAKFQDKYFLKGGGHWYQNTAITSGAWVHTKNTPDKVVNLAKKYFEEDQPESDEGVSDVIPKIIVTTEPAELIVTAGELEYEPIEGTSLLYVTNTESDIILYIDTQLHYLLLNGRWYASKSMSDADWQFVEPNDLPLEFDSIPAQGSSISSVRSSVPGTPEAKEAYYDQFIPQTAKVDRKTATTKVEYDGDPKFEAIEGTSMSYAVNTASTVILAEGRYFVVDNGVWFQASDPKGPWTVSDTRPKEVEEIPPSEPVYNVKYVYVYDSTPEVVYVGYTPGYYNSYAYGGMVYYGTGYYYRPWYGYYYYPRPVTYGFGVHYNPYTGWGFSVGISYGWMTFGFHSGGYWGPGGYMHGYRHGYYRGYHHGYHNGYRAGYARGRYDSSNAYRGRSNIDGSSRGRNGSRPGISTRDVKRGEGRVNPRPSTNDRNIRNNSNRNNPNTRENPNRTGPQSQRNNVYSDKNGNVYQRDRSGNWERKRNGNTDKKRDGTQGNRPQNNTRSRPNSNIQNRQQLERQYNNRSRGNSNYRSYNNNRSRAGSMNRGGRSGSLRGRKG